jgi:stage V sporulation protein K
MSTADTTAAIELLKDIILEIRKRGATDALGTPPPAPQAPGRVDGANFPATLDQSVTTTPLEPRSAQNDFIVDSDKKTAELAARTAVSLATPRGPMSGSASLVRVVTERRQRRIALARARMIREQQAAVAGVARLPRVVDPDYIPATPLGPDGNYQPPTKRRQRGSPEAPLPPAPPREPEPPMPTELTIGNLARELRRPDSLVRALFLRSRRANLQAWLPKIALRRAEIEARRDGRIAKERPVPTPTTTTTGTPKRGPRPKRPFIVPDDDESAINSTTGVSVEDVPLSTVNKEAGSDDPQADVDELEFEKMLLARLGLIETQINDELSVSAPAPVPELRTPKTPPATRLRRRQRLDEAEGPDPDANDIADVLNAVSNEERRRSEAAAQTASDAMDALDTLTGLELLKNNVTRLVVSSLVNTNPDAALFGDHRNILLMGEPGTGKTESAAIIGNILRAVGLVADQNRNVYPSYTRADLIAGVIGGTSIRVRYKFAVSWGNMMFIDELYALNGGNEDSYGREAIDAIVKFSDDFKGEVLLIGAGYESLIRARIFPVNSGFSSRFPNQWTLSNYSSKQLQAIVRRLLASPATPNAVLPLTPTPSPPTLPVPRTPPQPLDITRAEAIQAELIDRAHVMGFFADSNARGARNLVNALLDQRRVRIFGDVFNRKASALDTFMADARSERQLTPADVYRGFLLWVQSSRNEHVYFLDARVDAFVADLD